MPKRSTKFRPTDARLDPLRTAVCKACGKAILEPRGDNRGEGQWIHVQLPAWIHVPKPEVS